jgi:hypothetical protein
MIQEINFSIVNMCNAKCFFCPRDQYEADKKIMPLELIERVAGEVKGKEFEEAGHKILNCCVGENGEPTLHPFFIDALRAIRKISPSVLLFTNFSRLTKDKSEIIIKEHLVDSINTNVDGIGSRSYTQAKGLDYDTFAQNVMDFFVARTVSGDDRIRLHMHIVTAENYTAAVKKHFGVSPNKNIDPLSTGEAEQIKAYWQKIIGIQDAIGIEDNLMWAERNTAPVKVGKFRCPNINRVKTCVYLNPAGDWYACCFDAGNELKLGNVWGQSLVDIYKSSKKESLISYLEGGNFDKIGMPCARVDACQVVSND